MANTIQLRNSVVKDKTPLPSQLVIGEVCVGAHEESPMLIFKDNADNIIKIEPGSGVTPGPAPGPDSPSAGDLWFDTDTQLLYYYNGSAWVELGTAGDSPVTSVNSKVGAVVLTAADVGAVTIGDVNPTYFANQSAFPDAASPAVHGGVAHSHADGAMFFAHDGVWTELANASDIGEGLWEEDGNAVTPKKAGSDIKTVHDNLVTNILEANTGGAVFSGSCRAGVVGGFAPADGAVGANLSAAGVITATRGSGNVFETRVEGQTQVTSSITADGKLTAAVFDLESLDPLPA